MKKKLLLCLLSVVLCACMASFFVGCGGKCEHEFGEWQTEVLGTCTMAGTRAHKQCTKCNKYFDGEDNQLSSIVLGYGEHEFGELQAEVLGTCTTKGVKEHKQCAVCNKYFDYEGEELESIDLGYGGHDYVYHQGQSKTCTTAGWYDYETCANCDYTTYEAIPASHEITEYPAQAPTCDYVGWNAHEACSDCDYSTKVEIPATGHTYSDQWSKDNYYHWRVNTCGDYAPKKDYEYHTFDASYTCTACNYKKSASTYLTYSYSGDTATVTGYTSTESVVVIPETHDGYTVTAIDKWAFKDNTRIEAIVMPSSIISIGERAFWNCTSLETVWLGENSKLENLGEGAFRSCESLTGVAIPDGVVTLSKEAFYGCYAFASKTLAQTVN